MHMPSFLRCGVKKGEGRLGYVRHDAIILLLLYILPFLLFDTLCTEWF